MAEANQHVAKGGGRKSATIAAAGKISCGGIPQAAGDHSRAPAIAAPSLLMEEGEAKMTEDEFAAMDKMRGSVHAKLKIKLGAGWVCTIKERPNKVKDKYYFPPKPDHKRKLRSENNVFDYVKSLKK
jgi:hypothetical protein